MEINTNRWNRIRYTLYVPLYDLVGKIFSKSRAKAIEKLGIRSNDRVLLIGAGTGLDIKYIPTGAEVYATDITPAMVNIIQKKYGEEAEAKVMDGQDLQFTDQHFDKIILHLILAVIPDPHKCIREAERVLKPGGKIAVFDKFLEPGQKPNFIRRFFNIFTSFLFSDINRNLEEIKKSTSLKITNQEKADFGGVFKIYILEKM
ncbi:MAG: class I SAM-dependent methyltransferase [Candidatus Cyclobacteriaceae bacterium M2_1C_046]